MSREQDYNTYKIHCYGKPVGYGHFKACVPEVGIEGMLLRSINRKLKSFNMYLEECLDRNVTPLSESSYSRHKNKPSFWSMHDNTDMLEFNKGDINYIGKRRYKTIERKSFINQNMCLFYKMYFKRKYLQNS